MNPVQEKMIAEMGIGPQWKLRVNSHENQILSQLVVSTNSSFTSNDPPGLSAQVKVENVIDTEANNSTCQVCAWCAITSKAIASGQSSAVNYLFIHEHPSDSESAKVSVLAGAADALLNGILRELRIKRGVSAYLASIVKTKPIEVAGRCVNEQDGEILACVSCVKKQIELLRPSVIISLGNIAAISLLGFERNLSINDLRGTMHQYDGIPLIVTHELDYLLQHPAEKHSLWSDLCLAMNASQIH